MLNMKKLFVVAFVLIGIGIVGSLFTFTSYSETESVLEEAEFDSDKIEEIDLQTDNAKVEVLPIDSSSSKVKVISEGKDYRLSSNVKNNSLSIEMKHKRHRLFNLDFFGEGASLTVYVPEKQYKSINVKSNNGKIVVKDIEADDVAVDTDNGKIELQQVNTASIYAETNNGQISLNEVEGDLVGRTNNGGIYLKTTHIDRPIDLQTDNGRIEIKTEKEPKNVVYDVKTGNGKVTIFENSNWDTMIGNGEHLVKLRTANGRISISQ